MHPKTSLDLEKEVKTYLEESLEFLLNNEEEKAHDAFYNSFLRQYILHLSPERPKHNKKDLKE